MDKIELKTTGRGFPIGEFTDKYKQKCSIQKSSLAAEDAIWLGVDDADPKIMSSDAIRMGLRERTFDENDNGWVSYELPKEVLLSTRMHLTQEMVADLLPMLKKFAETGELS